MNSGVPSPVASFVFFTLAALVLFGVFLSPGLFRRIGAWWRSISLHPFEPGDPVHTPGLAKEPGPAHDHSPHLHPQPPHVEKKGAPAHRSG